MKAFIGFVILLVIAAFFVPPLRRLHSYGDHYRRGMGLTSEPAVNEVGPRGAASEPYLRDFVAVARLALRMQAQPRHRPAEARILVSGGVGGWDTSNIKGHQGSKSVTQSRMRSSLVQGRMPLKFLVVTGERSFACKTARGAHILLQSYKNKVDYCTFHGNCKVWYMMETWEEGYYGVWARYPALLRLMRSLPNIEWFMWMDADSIFTDLNFTIPFQIYDAWSKNLIVHGFASMLYVEEGNWISLNAGIILIRNCEWSHTFLRLWMTLGLRELRHEAKQAFNHDLKNRPHNMRADDQSALAYLLRKTQNETIDRVYLEAGYFLHGYYELMVDRFEHFAAVGRDAPPGHVDQWPFITHFCGCDFCGGRSVSSACQRGFTRAYNFADNQLLVSTKTDLYHPNLNISGHVTMSVA